MVEFSISVTLLLLVDVCVNVALIFYGDCLFECVPLLLVSIFF